MAFEAEDQPAGPTKRARVSKPRPIAVGLRLEESELVLLDEARRPTGLGRASWVRGKVLQTLCAKPTFPEEATITLAQIRIELRRIGISARRLAETAERKSMPRAEIDKAWRLHTLIREQLLGVRNAVEGNLEYWSAGDDRVP